MKRVLHVIGAMGCGGAETVIMNLYRAIDRSVIQFDFVVHTNQKSFYDEEIESLGGRIYRTDRFTGNNFFVYKKFWNNFFDQHPEYYIVHGHINSCAAIYLKVAKDKGRFTIAHSHSTKRFEHTFKAYAFRIFAFPLRFIADYFMACSRQAAIDRYGKKIANSSKCRILMNGIDVERFTYNEQTRTRIRKENGVDKKLVVGHVGRFTSVKNHKYLIDVFVQIKKIKPDSVLWLLGSGELENEIREYVRKMHLSADVIFWGVKSNVEDYLQGMDVFIFPSIKEGLGMSLVEAQVSGLTCVASGVIQNEAIIAPEKVALLPLTCPPHIWAAKAIEIYEQTKRRSMEQEAMIAGYNADDVASWLKNFYLNNWKS